MAQSFLELLQTGIVLVTDGATGTNLQRHGLPPGTPPDDWVFENPQAVQSLHRDFIQAGSNIILTNSFGGTRLRMHNSQYAERAPELNFQAARLARQVADPAGVWVAGSMGPCGSLLKPFGPLMVEEAAAAFAEQAKALSEGGVDFLLIETHFSLEEAQAAVEGSRQASQLPIVVSFSFDRGLRTMMGVKPEQVIETFKSYNLAAIGANCGKSLDFMLQVINAMSAANPGVPLWAKPNAGMPIPGTSPAEYDVNPDQMGEYAWRLVQAGAQLVGGCCGTTPEHIRGIAQAVKNPQ
jgi:5-methyltetrahydrofolate--homocysteine methyltransferase